MNVSVEDYMRTLYGIYERQGFKEGIKSIDVADEMQISKSSVSQMFNKLKDLKLIKRDAYSKVSFTKDGLKEAKRVMHNHRVIEVFLKDVLDYELSKVHEEAHRLEHAFSEESIKRLDRFLQNPTRSPSGKNIPHD